VRVAMFFIVGSWIAACGSPCRTLAEVVCACNDSRSVEQSCLAEVTLAAEASPASDASEDYCSERLESCTCDALGRGDYASCGLAEAPQTP
jgi:hypothetical protein